MLFKCIQCISVQKSTIRTIRISASYFSEKTQKRKFLDSIKDYKNSQILEDKEPEKESLSTIFKVQKVTNPIPEGFKTIYKFPQIRYFSLVNRLKVYQTAFAILAIGGSSIFYGCGIVSVDALVASTFFGVAGSAMFYSLGYLANGFIGFIYYNEKSDKVRIAYVDFWGRRRNIEIPRQDIVPKNDSPVGLVNKIWFPLRRYSTNEILKLQLEQGIIYDQKIFKKIL